MSSELLSIQRGAIVNPSSALSIKDKYTHSHANETHTRASSHRPARSTPEWERWHCFELNCGTCFLPSKHQIGRGEKALNCVPITFPVRLTHNEALCHCHIALLQRRSTRNALKVIITDEWGKGQRRLAKNRHRYRNVSDNERRTWILTDDEKISGNDLAFVKFWELKACFFNFLFPPSTKWQRSNQKYRRARCGFYCYMDHCGNHSWKKKNRWYWNYDSNHRNTGPLRGTHKILCILYFCSPVNVKGILKEVQQDSGASAFVCISAVLQDSKIISFNPLSQGSS